jgi:hypothetical protein
MRHFLSELLKKYHIADIVPFEEVYCTYAQKLSARSVQGAPIALVNQGAVGSVGNRGYRYV